MKISYSWLKDYVSTSLSPESMAEILTQTGLEVEGVHPVEAVPGGLQGLLVGEVIHKEKHPNADRLSLTRVNVGNGEDLQIVCGAPNVAQGQKVIVATVGTTLHPTGGEAFKIKKGKIRGEASFGMICAEDEIGLGEDHDGIMVLDEAAVPGTPASDYFGLENDYSIEIGLTPNRTDGMCHFGVARDLVAALHNMEGIENDANAKASLPSVDAFPSVDSTGKIHVEVLDTAACPRYAGVEIEGIKVAPSPDWLQKRLKAIGLSPINNVVDITNYVLHETGQPLHAFDAGKILGNKVVVTQLPNETKFISLDEQERKLNGADLMICNAKAIDGDKSKAGMCIAGVFGGIESGVSDSTTSIFLESAVFDTVSIRKTAKRHGLHTDASFRFERGVDPEMTIYALKRAAMLIAEIAGGKISSSITDIYPTALTPFDVKFRPAKAALLIGKEIPDAGVRAILEDLDIKVDSQENDSWNLKVPVYRRDVTREADVVEEILRIHGYNNVADPSKLRTSLSFRSVPDREALVNKVSDFLASRGWNEIMSNSLTKEKYGEVELGERYTESSRVAMLNPLSADMGVMRQSLLFGGLEAIELNQNQRNSDLSLFEFGREYRKSGDGYDEEMHLALFLTGNALPESWEQPTTEFRFRDMLAAVEACLANLGLGDDLVSTSVSGGAYSEGATLAIGDKAVATLGWVNVDLLKSFDIKNPVLYADIDWDTIVDLSVGKDIVFAELPKFPAVKRDLSMLFDKSVEFQQIASVAKKTERDILRTVNLFDVYEGKNMEAGKKSYAVSFILQDYDKTLTDKRIEKTMNRIQSALESELGAVLR